MCYRVFRGLQFVGQTSNSRLRINNHKSCILMVVYPEVVFGFTNILHRMNIMDLLLLSSTVARLVTWMFTSPTGSLNWIRFIPLGSIVWMLIQHICTLRTSRLYAMSMRVCCGDFYARKRRILVKSNAAVRLFSNVRWTRFAFRAVVIDRRCGRSMPRAAILSMTKTRHRETEGIL